MQNCNTKFKKSYCLSSCSATLMNKLSDNLSLTSVHWIFLQYFENVDISWSELALLPILPTFCYIVSF